MAPDPTITLFTPHDDCTGCSACAQRCPAHAIYMTPDDEGFIRAAVHPETCIHCGLCNKVCPVAEGKDTPPKDALAAYAAWNGNHEELMKSSSGGIFSLLARHILNQGGVVFGSVYDERGRVFHDAADTEEGLQRMRGSKYVQSDMRDCFPRVKAYLKGGRKVLFTGVPCQIAGLRAYLGKEDENLLTMEIICEGAPSPGLLATHLHQQCPDMDTVESLSFRDKAFGWTQTLLVRYRTAAGEPKCFVSPAAKDAYIRVMFAAVSQGKNCYRCRFREGRSGADITIGDMWGIGIVAPDVTPTHGASAVLTNTPKGAEVYAAIAKGLGTNRAIAPLSAAINNGYLFRAPKIDPAARELFYAGYKAGKPIAECAEAALQRSNRIAILNHAGHTSYGSNLTAYALQEHLRREGYDARIVSLRPFRSPYPQRLRPFRSFINTVLRWTRDCYGPADCAALNKDFETFIVGSDQVWRHPKSWLRRCAEPAFYLEFAAQGKRRIAYAASFGLSRYQGPRRLAKRFRRALQDFDAVSVRERQGVTILQEQFGYTAAQAVLDPVFLLSERDWCRFSSAAAEQEDTAPTVRGFFFFNEALATKPTQSCAAAHDWAFARLDQGGPDVMSWLKRIQKSPFLVTDSFHLMCFAIIFRRPFAVISSEAHGKSRLQDLLQTLGLEDRLIDTDVEGTSAERLTARLETLIDEPINFEQVEVRLATLRAASATWLLHAINQEPSAKHTVLPHRPLQARAERLPWHLFRLYRPVEACTRTVMSFPRRVIGYIKRHYITPHFSSHG